ncbi:MAG: flippase [Richelia sp. SM1_7_0]|nr:flippase [Richelia sp. SM1_7_0]
MKEKEKEKNTNINPKKNSFLKDISSVMGNKIFIITIEFLSSIIISRQLGVEGKGIYISLLIFPNLVVSFAEMGIQKATVNYIAKERYSQSDITSVVMFLLVFSSLLGTSICGGIYKIIDNSSFSDLMILISLLLIPLRLTNSYVVGILIGREQIRLFNRVQFLPFLSKFLFIVLFVLIGRTYINGAITSHLLAAFLTALYSLWVLSQLGKIRIKYIYEIVKGLLSLGIIYAITLFILNLNYKIDVVILEHFSSAAEIGKYTTGVNITELIWYLPMALEVVVFSRSANTQNHKEFSYKIAKLMRVTLISAIFGGVILCLIAPTLIPMLYGNQFIGSARILQILMPGVVAFTIVKILYMDIAGKGKPGITLFILIPALMMNIILNLIWIPQYGANGAALASTVSYSLSGIGFSLMYSYITRIPVSNLFKFQLKDFDFIYQKINTYHSNKQ